MKRLNAVDGMTDRYPDFDECPVNHLGVVWLPTVQLRFIEREGRRILQQLWQTEISRPVGFVPSIHILNPGLCEWRDVRLVDQNLTTFGPDSEGSKASG